MSWGMGLRCSWFQMGTGRLELRALTAWGKKLLSNLTERALILRYLLPDGRSWKRLWEGWVGSRPCWSIVQGKCPGWRGEGHRWSLRQCSLSVVGSCSQQHCSFHTRQWCRWSAHSQWCPCRKWWGWVEGDLPFSAGGESGGAVVPSCWMTWCWWSRWDPL